jgi:hypothetical protein
MVSGWEREAPRVERKRRENERKFGNWEELPDGGRRYFYEIQGRAGWKARYVKEVDTSEQTIRFYQEIYNERGQLVEIHEKYPMDKGHKRVQEGSYEGFPTKGCSKNH